MGFADLRAPLATHRDPLLLIRMATEHPGQAELTELVPDHVFGAKDVDEMSAVVDLESMTDELGDDGASASPGLDRDAPILVAQSLNLAKQLLVNVRAFFQ